MSDALTHPHRPVTRTFLAKVFAIAGRGIAEKINAKFATLEARIVQLEQRPVVKYVGTHVSGMKYSEANLCTRSGSLWIATCETSSTPGESDGWKLVVKRGAA
jgi:hypothetical protein